MMLLATVSRLEVGSFEQRCCACLYAPGVDTIRRLWRDVDPRLSMRLSVIPLFPASYGVGTCTSWTYRMVGQARASGGRRHHGRDRHPRGVRHLEQGGCHARRRRDRPRQTSKGRDQLLAAACVFSLPFSCVSSHVFVEASVCFV